MANAADPNPLNRHAAMIDAALNVGHDYRGIDQRIHIWNQQARRKTGTKKDDHLLLCGQTCFKPSSIWVKNMGKARTNRFFDALTVQPVQAEQG